MNHLSALYSSWFTPQFIIVHWTLSSSRVSSLTGSVAKQFGEETKLTSLEPMMGDSRSGLEASCGPYFANLALHICWPRVTTDQLVVVFRLCFSCNGWSFPKRIRWPCELSKVCAAQRAKRIFQCRCIVDLRWLHQRLGRHWNWDRVALSLRQIWGIS